MYKTKPKAEVCFRKLSSNIPLSSYLPPLTNPHLRNKNKTHSPIKKKSIHVHTRNSKTRHCIMKTGPGQGVKMHGKQTPNEVRLRE